MYKFVRIRGVAGLIPRNDETGVAVMRLRDATVPHISCWMDVRDAARPDNDHNEWGIVVQRAGSDKL